MSSEFQECVCTEARRDEAAVTGARINKKERERGKEREVKRESGAWERPGQGQAQGQVRGQGES